jgi:hypothetical protein
MFTKAFASKVIGIVVAVLTFVSLLGPSLASVAGFLPPTIVRDIGAVIGACGTAILWLQESPLQRMIVMSRGLSAAKSLGLRSLGVLFLVAWLSGCAAFQSAEPKMASAVLPVAECVAALVSVVTDPSALDLETAIQLCAAAGTDVVSAADALVAASKAPSGAQILSPKTATAVLSLHRRVASKAVHK